MQSDDEDKQLRNYSTVKGRMNLSKGECMCYRGKSEKEIASYLNLYSTN